MNDCDSGCCLSSFMNPLAVEIWLYILLAYILVSITIWIVARLVGGGGDTPIFACETSR